MELRLGIAGLGLGARLMLPIIDSDPRYRIVAAADPRLDAAEALVAPTGGTGYSSVGTMLDSAEIDAIYIATPTHLHVDHVTAAARRGKHVIVEKPIAHSLEHAEGIVREVDRAGVALVCGHTHGFDGAILAMRELLVSGRLGVLRSLLTWNANEYLYRPRAAWDLDPRNGGGVVFNQGAHQVEILRTIAGDAIETVHAATTRDTRRSVDGSFHALLRFSNGVSATAIFNGCGFFDTGELFGYWTGERGEPRDPATHARAWEGFTHRTAGPDDVEEESLRDELRYGGETVGSESDGWEKAPFFGMTLMSCAEGEARQTPDGLMVYTPDGPEHLPVSDRYADGARRVLTELYDAVVGGTRPIHGARWAATTVAVCAAIMESAATHDIVSVPRL